MKKATLLASVVLAGVLTAGVVRAEDAKDASVLSPFMKSAIERLTSDDYQERMKASADLESAIAEQAMELASCRHPEARTRIEEALEFSNSLNRWISDVLKLPADVRAEQLAFISRKNLMPVIAEIFARKDETRAEGVHKLAAIDDAGADVMLVHLVDDPSRAVSLAAMEALWDRKPSDAIVECLWRRAVESGLARPNVPPTPVLTFRGRPVPDRSGLFTTLLASRDSDIACEVLIHLKAPQVEGKINNFFDRAVHALADADVSVAQPYFSNSGPSRNVWRLLEAYKPKSALPKLYAIATGRVVIEYNARAENGRLYLSNRTLAIAGVLLLTGQNPDDYKIQRVDRVFAQWDFPSKLVEEDAVTKLKGWRAEHPDAAAAQ